MAHNVSHERHLFASLQLPADQWRDQTVAEVSHLLSFLFIHLNRTPLRSSSGSISQRPAAWGGGISCGNRCQSARLEEMRHHSGRRLVFG
ncbi:hypothetical protein L1N85_26720, partial [Paenibacillus alkaliterrae]|uniref:hypothetical protein n=1 Tax=Paenibacillus alkaliterrae TaxID=320909 RepID=UPI001F3404ED